MNATLKALNAEMKAVTSSFDENDRSMESLTAQNQVLQKQWDAQANKVALIKDRLEKLVENGVDPASRRYQDLVRDMYNTEAALHKTMNQFQSNTEAMKQLGDGVEEASEAMEEAGGSALSFGDLIKANLTSEAIIGGVKALGSALLELGRDAIEGYADLEQLTGGVETLFGSGASQVIANSQEAYKTAGLSANEYMETVTGFSAALIQSLGGDTKAAAALADQAITDMADNANKMGTSIDSIQNAYSGFAKSNFTMLDNLKLGYGGTKAEMERLLADAEKLSGIHYDISSYADIVNAIHVVQTEMGITGTTALEAAETISGSTSSMKSAWDNLVSGMADANADIDTLVANWMESVQTAASNVGAAIMTILGNLELFSQGVGVDSTINSIDSASEKLRAAAENTQYWNEQMTWSTAATMAMSGGMEYLTLSALTADEQLKALQADAEVQAGIFEEVSAGTLTAAEAADLLGVSETELASMMEQAAAAAETNAQGFASVTEAEEALAAMTRDLTGSYPSFVKAVEDAGVSVEHLSQYLIDNELTAEEWGSQVQGSVDGIVNKFSAANTDLGMSVSDMEANLQQNITSYNEWQSNIQTLMDAAVQSGDQAAVDFVNYMQQLGVGAADQIAEMVQDVNGTLDTFAPLFEEAAEAGIQQTVSGIEGGSGEVDGSVDSLMSEAVSAAESRTGEFNDVGYQISAGIAEGVQAGSGAVTAAVRSVVQIAVAAAQAEAQIHSPSDLLRDEVGWYMGLGVAKGLEDSEDENVKAARQLASKVYSELQKWAGRIVKYEALNTKGELELWETIQSQFIKGSEQYESAYEKIFDLKQKLLKEDFENSKDWISKQVKYYDMSIEDQIAAWERVKDRFAAGTEQYESAYEKIFDLKQELLKEDFENSKDWISKQVKYYDMSIEDQIAAWERVKDRFAAGTEQYAEATANIFDLTWQRERDNADALQARVEEIYSIYGLFDEIPERERKSGHELAKNLQDQINNLRGFFNGLEDLTARGMSDALVDEIRAMGPAALDELNALLSMSDEQLDEYAELYGEKQRLANEIALSELQTLGDDTIELITDNLLRAENLYNTEAPDVGLAFSDGLANGILSGESTVINAAIAVAKAALAATRDELGIHSPSTAYEDVGFFSAEGYAKGFVERMQQIQSRMTAAIPVQDISLADAASGIVNGLSGQYGGSSAAPRVIQLVVNGRVLAEETIDDFFEVGAANGTPLTAGSYA